MVQIKTEQVETAVVMQSWRRVLPTLLSGAIVGLVTWVGTFLLSEYVIGPIACRVGSSLISCSDNAAVSSNVALIVAGVVALGLLVRQRVLRPLLVVLAAVASLWGLGSWLSNDAWYLSLVLSVVLSALVYAVFAWFSELRRFWVAFAVTIALVLVFRLLVS